MAPQGARDLVTLDGDLPPGLALNEVEMQRRWRSGPGRSGGWISPPQVIGAFLSVVRGADDRIVAHFVAEESGSVLSLTWTGRCEANA